MKPIKFVKTGGGGYTDVYCCEIQKSDLTVIELVRYIMTMTNDWGIITIHVGKYQSYQYEYKHGALIDVPAVNIGYLIVKKITASGGWTRMDYDVTVDVKTGFVDEQGAQRHTLTRAELQSIYNGLDKLRADCTLDECVEIGDAFIKVFTLIHKHMNE